MEAAGVRVTVPRANNIGRIKYLTWRHRPLVSGTAQPDQTTSWECNPMISLTNNLRHFIGSRQVCNEISSVYVTSERRLREVTMADDKPKLRIALASGATVSSSWRLRRRCSDWFSSQSLKGILLLLKVRAVGSVFLDQNYSIFAGLSANADPIVDTWTVQDSTSVHLFAHWVVVSKLLKNSTVARTSLIDCAQTIKWAALSPHSLHSNTYCHVSISPSVSKNQGPE